MDSRWATHPYSRELPCEQAMVPGRDLLGEPLVLLDDVILMAEAEQ
jgi:hypothetical protein